MFFDLLGCPRKIGSMVRINGLSHLLINGIYWGEITHLQTIDPIFLGHPSMAMDCLYLDVKAFQQQ